MGVDRLGNIELKLCRVETLQEENTKAIQGMAQSIDKLVTKLEESDDLAREASQSARSAHKRIDAINRVLLWAAAAVGSAVIAAIMKGVLK